ncbi:protein translocase SEC61 complex subunit gamma [Candidatus Woesearchaeota archaeon]|nr:protein translocase SEC61 complex subunit gamma [Candidatus Woesearchaeota archaeon]
MEQNQENTEEQPAQLFVKQKSEEFKFQKKTFKEKFKQFCVECKRVLKVTKKPSRDEFKNIVKVTGIGILIIGLIGFLIHFLKELVF